MLSILTACHIAVLACALVAGVFLTFSDFVMRSLGRAEAAHGMEVMQVINREVFRWVFMTLFLGMAALSLLLIGVAYLYLEGAAAAYVWAGSGLYLIGVFGITAAFNVPMNNRLAAMESSSAAAVRYWQTRYLPNWTRWNSLRTLASCLAALCFLLAVTTMASF